MNETECRLNEVTDQIVDLVRRALGLQCLKRDLEIKKPLSDEVKKALTVALAEIQLELERLRLERDELRKKFELEQITAIWPGKPEQPPAQS